MTIRSCWYLTLGIALLSGCDDGVESAPPRYTLNEALLGPLEGKPKLQAAVSRALADLYGPAPREMHVPPNAPLTRGGMYLASRVRRESSEGVSKPERMKYRDPATGKDQYVEGGYALFRHHCLPCHGRLGGGDGMAAESLWPRPRDFRLGIFKFTSSRRPDKPARDDLRRTISKGLANSAMPPFEFVLSPGQIEQVIDYVIFLSLRGETEHRLIDRASTFDETEADQALAASDQDEIVARLFDEWRRAEAEIVRPPQPAPPATASSLERGRALFLGRTAEKLQCAGCHGSQADGNGPDWIDLKTFYKYAFSNDPAQFRILKEIAESRQQKWGDSWGQPLRPADLSKGVFKGGREPADLYRRIARGINGTPMPPQSPPLQPEEIWDLVHFVLALHDHPELLRDAPAVAMPTPRELRAATR